MSRSSLKFGDSKAAHEAKPLSLSHLAAAVLRFIEGRQSTTFQEVADRVSIEVSPVGSETVSEKATRRRVYDVLNVFLASGLVVREGRSIRYQRPEESPATAFPSASLPPALRKKENALYEKVRMLVAYETLIRYNSIRQRGPSVVQLPAIIVGFSSTITGACNASLDGRSLEIQASENPVFYSPMDVFEKIGFPNANQSQTLRQFPELAALDSILFPSSRSA